MGTWRRPYIRNAKEPEYPRRRKRAGWGRIKLRQRMRKGMFGRGWRWRRKRMELKHYRFGWWKKDRLIRMKRSEREAMWARLEEST